MVETPFDYPRLRREERRGTNPPLGGMRKWSYVWRTRANSIQVSEFGDRLNAAGEAPTDTLLARFLIRISVLSIAQEERTASPRCFFTKTDELTVRDEETVATRESDSQLPLNVFSR